VAILFLKLSKSKYKQSLCLKRLPTILYIIEVMKNKRKGMI
jgi:hypothetical protein